MPAGLCRLHWLEHRLDPHRNRPEKAPGHHSPGGTSKKRHLDCGHKGWDMGASPGTEAGTTPCPIAAPGQIQGDLCRFPFIPCLTAPAMLSGSTSFVFTAVNILFMSFVCQQSCAASLQPSLSLNGVFLLSAALGKRRASGISPEAMNPQMSKLCDSFNSLQCDPLSKLTMYLRGGL